ncbi:adenosylmethionine-8-amino-7-oxononanoate aminotransferase [Thalassobaculum fulvum]|uniref:Adenosylmethionine-8-amino-7-oxononanoate aminotransferase n=1 Tax=Thalassobaculum fulvum TaxID=1633335 RepID=A0A918XYD5_9PROT|nr:aspartate aminotransferase family protein [Thalassobaculum fulvum]GHD63741.1 adenosylmethionine-8-amino-7-oxononanoate aminotransferase [Thalassobaculum fulvum]
MTHVFHRQTKSVPPTAAVGDGVYIVDATGKRYLDASGGAAVSCLGHSDVRVVNAIKAQLDAIPYAHTGFFTNEPMEKLADFLVDAAPGDLDMVYFVSGGSEGVEAALKMARQYFLEIGQPERYRIIARRQSYHGNTLGALSIGGNEWRREQFRPLLIDATHVAPCYEYRDRRDGETTEEYGIRVADELDAAIRAAGPETVAAFVCEPVVGATAGALPAVPGYLKRIREICDRHGVLLIFDEVMCGMGRTGHLFACEEDGVAPDLLVIAKGLGAGYQPIGAVLVDGRIYAAIRDGSGFFQHGHTYMGHPAACAAGLAVQHVIRDDNLLDNVKVRGAALRRALESRFGNNPYVGDIRGRGLFLGIEMVADRASKEPFDPARKLNAAIKREALERGLMVYPMGGTIDGRRGDHVLVAPPFIIDDSHIGEIVDKLGDSIDAALTG